MKLNKRIAVLIATYNGGKYIEDLLKSLLNQTFQDFECLIHDDGSGDGTQTILNQYSRRYPDKFQILEYQPMGRSNKNFYSLMQKADHPYVMFCDQDDVWLEDKIKRSYETIKRLEDKYGADKPIAAFSDLIVVDQELNTIHPSFFQYSDINPDRFSLPQLMTGNIAAGCSMIINRKLNRTASSDSDNPVMHDWWCMQIASALGYIKRIPSPPMILYRQHADNVVGSAEFKKARNLFHKLQNKILNLGSAAPSSYLKMQRNNALMLAAIIGEDCRWYEFLNQFAHISTKKKTERITFYQKYNLINPHSCKCWILLWV